MRGDVVVDGRGLEPMFGFLVVGVSESDCLEFLFISLDSCTAS